MKLAEFGDGGGYGGPAWRGGHRHVSTLAPAESTLLWAMRRMALLQPLGAARCHAVHIALQQDFGDTGLGIEHLLRCCLVGLARVATRRLAIGAPACPMLTADEMVFLGLVRRPDERALVGLAGSAGSAALLPLFGALAGLARLDRPAPAIRDENGSVPG